MKASTRAARPAMAASRRLCQAAILVLGIGHAAAAAASSSASATPTSGLSVSTSTFSTIEVTGTSLAEVVRESEACAYLCYEGACEDSDCSSGDFACVCQNPNSLVVKMGICVGKYCDGGPTFDAGDWLASLCDVYKNTTASEAVASASALLVSEIAAAAATATNNPLPSASVAAEATSSDASSVAGRVLAPVLLPLAVGLVGGAVAVVAFPL